MHGLRTVKCSARMLRARHSSLRVERSSSIRNSLPALSSPLSALTSSTQSILHLHPSVIISPLPSVFSTVSLSPSEGYYYEGASCIKCILVTVRSNAPFITLRPLIGRSVVHLHFPLTPHASRLTPHASRLTPHAMSRTFDPSVQYPFTRTTPPQPRSRLSSLLSFSPIRLPRSPRRPPRHRLLLCRIRARHPAHTSLPR